jgi:peptidoglycan hydrolase-like protein with peptidoglycan-binding domain
MITRLTERDLSRIVRRVINEQDENDILKVQKSLNKVWTNVKIKEDGIMGPETKKTIEKYQKQMGMPVTGNIDDKVKTKLFRLLEDDPIFKNSKMDLIRILKNHLQSLEEDDVDANVVAEVIYNDCANFMNKSDIFSDKSKYGQPYKTKVPFAPNN